MTVAPRKGHHLRPVELQKESVEEMKKFVAMSLSAVAVCSALCGCSSNDDEQKGFDTEAAPASVTWDGSHTRGIKVPSSKEDGPENTSPVPHGWSASPQGAVLAAINTQAWMATAGEDTWPQVGRMMIAPGQGLDQWAQARSLMDIDGEIANPPAFKGFKFSEFSETKAVVLLAADYPGQGLLAYPVQLDRSSGDWRVVLPTQGNEPDLTPLSDDAFEKFVKFGA